MSREGRRLMTRVNCDLWLLVFIIIFLIMRSICAAARHVPAREQHIFTCLVL